MAEQNLIIIDYEDLKSDPFKSSERLSPLLSKAFGSDPNSNSLGIIAIRNIPSFVETKHSFLPLAHKLAHLPTAYLEEKLTDAPSMYNAGWSHGKEKLGDKPDLNKASFYFNPITDIPGTQQDRDLYPASYPVNKWPDREVLPDLEDVGKQMGCLMKHVVALLAKHVDVYVQSKCSAYKPIMGDEMDKTEKVKGRLLYYFPLALDENSEDGAGVGQDSWIGWHNDSGFFTALTGDLFVDHDSGETVPRDEVDPNAGLIVMDRNGNSIKVEVPEDCMAVQIGECLQIITGGNVVATPHCVRGVDPKWNEGKGRKVARISFPCFVDTVPSFPLKLPDGSTRDGVFKSSIEGCAKVPPLSERYVAALDFFVGFDFFDPVYLPVSWKHSNYVPCSMFNVQCTVDGKEMEWNLVRSYKKHLQDIMSGLRRAKLLVTKL